MGKLKIDIDSQSGFCAGVIRAISTAEKELSVEPAPGKLYSLGAIVHNEMELRRLQTMGLGVTSVDALPSLDGNSSVLIRAHGEPPATYSLIDKYGYRLIDCTCPVVLKLQKDIAAAAGRGSRVIIFGKKGHAEVLGLLGHAGPDAVVVESSGDIPQAGILRAGVRYELFSQTTKSPSEYREIASILEGLLPEGSLTVHDTICRQVSGRHEHLSAFAAAHDVILFVSGGESSNGKVLCNLCREVNQRTYHITQFSEIQPSWFDIGKGGDVPVTVGVCGATSTPRWLLSEIAENLADKFSFCTFAG
ncbi:MAG: 4-hydroxy-3-methylbut-2-enyl diphosphate reductase [Bacteroidales bacterium]|nr:4-hydroxy-3-methylbut-2-enyl diphosphate reductase [Bacteroidales bacterium]